MLAVKAFDAQLYSADCMGFKFTKDYSERTTPNTHNTMKSLWRDRFCLRLTLRVAVGFPPGPAIASRLLPSGPCWRFPSATARSSGVLRALLYSDVKSLRFESPSARQRFGPLAEPAIAPTDPDTPWLLPTELATRSFAGSVH